MLLSSLPLKLRSLPFPSSGAHAGLLPICCSSDKQKWVLSPVILDLLFLREACSSVEVCKLPRPQVFVSLSFRVFYDLCSKGSSLKYFRHRLLTLPDFCLILKVSSLMFLCPCSTSSTALPSQPRRLKTARPFLPPCLPCC